MTDLIDTGKIEIVTKRLVEAYHPLAIYLFGSYAWENPRYDSDLDLLIIVDKSDKKFYKKPVKGISSLRGLNISKDILVYTIDEFNKRANHVSTLCYKIKNKGKRLYGIS